MVLDTTEEVKLVPRKREIQSEQEESMIDNSASIIEESKTITESPSRRQSRALKNKQNRRRLKKLEEVVENNRLSISQMKPEDQLKTCPICQCDMEQPSTIEKCSH